MAMKTELSAYEARIIGCLLEKEVTTPELYPLTLNSLTLAVNQKSNRDPVYSVNEAEVLDTLEQLKAKRLVTALEGVGSRVTKYQHRFCNTEFGHLQFSPKERALICVLLLRGAQTPGELRTRTQRLCDFQDVKEVETMLTRLAQQGLIKQLAREPGKRESRYVHLFSGDSLEENAAIPTSSSQGNDLQYQDLVARITLLEEEVALLKQQLQLS